MTKQQLLKIVVKRVVAKPTRIHFTLKSGRSISIKAIRTVEQKEVVRVRILSS